MSTGNVVEGETGPRIEVTKPVVYLINDLGLELNGSTNISSPTCIWVRCTSYIGWFSDVVWKIQWLLS